MARTVVGCGCHRDSHEATSSQRDHVRAASKRLQSEEAGCVDRVGTLETQRILKGTVAQIASLSSTVEVSRAHSHCVGEVVRRGQELQWFHTTKRRPIKVICHLMQYEAMSLVTSAVLCGRCLTNDHTFESFLCIAYLAADSDHIAYAFHSAENGIPIAEQKLGFDTAQCST
jgi:hypothetical protein